MATEDVVEEVRRLTATVIANATRELLLVTSANNETDDGNTTTASIATPSSTVSTTLTTTQWTSRHPLTQLTSKAVPQVRTSFHMLAIFTSALFIAGALLIIKLIVSHNKQRRSLMASGSARWRLSASSASAQGGRTSGGIGAAYSPTSTDGHFVNSMDIPLPETRVDWERQFFDEDVYNQPVWDSSNRARTRLHLETEPLHI
ncbi:hypothetical protein Tcan_09492 [Toxocara canis]|uniref:Uncharacterized protein n=1 Tax=Toxocara canis TaxID=6265 RepID=A0A0B2VX45_TOXCA|nr:hypothetical protein Tcan_09492 [Toxocara canis]